MRRSLFGVGLAAVAGALLITACSSDSRSPTEAPPPPVEASIVPSGCPTVGQTAKMIVALYPAKGGARLLVTVTYAAILLYINTRHQADARTLVFRLLDFTFQQFNAGKLIGAFSMATRQQLLAFEMGLYCTVGLPTTGLTLPGDPGNPGTVNQVVFPSGNPQTVVTGDGNAGVLLPSGSFNTPAVVVTISVIPDTVPNPLNTKLDQYGPFYDVKVSPESGITSNLTVGLCLATGGDIGTVLLAHNVTQTVNGNATPGIEVLQPADPNAITGLCTPHLGSLSPREMLHLATHGDMHRAANALGSAVADLFLPTNAYAGSGGKTGTTKSFSPFGGVDTKVYLTTNPNPFPAQTAPAGSAVAKPPSALVSTFMKVPVGQVNVTFSVTGGGGTVAGGSSATVGTGANGIATVGDWVVNAGPNSVQAVGTFADPTVTFASGSQLTVTVDPAAGVTYTATGGDVVPYGSSYLFLDGPQGHDLGFEASSPTGWPTGNAPFGTVDEGGTCPLNSVGGLNSGWAVNTDLLLLKTFPLPSGWAVPLTISAAIDNDIQVFVNGHLLTPNAFTPPDASNYSFNSTSGFVTHENCATKGSLTYTVPAALLHGGQDTLAIRARDRGGLDYVDVKVTAP